MTPERFDHDVVVVGSGFGGAVAALRLAEKGYGVHVYESDERSIRVDTYILQDDEWGLTASRRLPRGGEPLEPG